MRSFLALFLFTLACAPATLCADTTTDYVFSGVLSDGGIFNGSFTLDDTLPDSFTLPDRGEFSLVNFDFELTNTTLFMSGPITATSGTAESASLFQSGVTDEAVLIINFVSDIPIGSLNSGVSTDLVFEPFTGDPNVLQFLDPESFSGGFFDGAGNADVVSSNLSVVPEPSSGLSVSYTHLTLPTKA